MPTVSEQGGRFLELLKRASISSSERRGGSSGVSPELTCGEMRRAERPCPVLHHLPALARQVRRRQESLPAATSSRRIRERRPRSPRTGTRNSPTDRRSG